MKWAPYTTIGNEEHEAVKRVIQSGTLSGFIAGPPDKRDVPNGGVEVRAFEKELAAEVGSLYAVSFNSATSALYAASVACTRRVETSPGDCVDGGHVITSPFTMSATAAASIAAGCVVDYADIELETFCIDPKSVEEVLRANMRGGFNTGAVVAVNLFGHPAQLTHLKNLCGHNKMYLIEDSSQTPYAMHDHRRAGTIGDIGIYSFNRHKHIHCGEGGIAVTNDEELARRLRSVRNHGIDPMGLNLRMTEIEAAIAHCQIPKLVGAVEHARQVAAALSAVLSNYMDVPAIRPGSTHDFYLWTAKGCPELSPDFPHIKGYIQPLHKIHHLAKGASYCPNADWAREHVTCFETAKYANNPDDIAEAFREAII